MGCTKNKYFISKYESGARNAITDVPGVRVGHVTVADGEIQTGVTAIMPHDGNIFKEKIPAGHAVFNGFGKTTGLVQVAELGTIETPIILTNTLSVGTAYTALVKYSLEHNEDIGVKTGTVNPLVCECNDGTLNDIRGLHVTEEHVFEAMAKAGEEVAEGAVGAGRGMKCYGLKGGIGTASRVVTIEDKTYTVGCLVLTNHGRLDDLRIMGRCISDMATEPDKGSVIVILATDAPLSDRQLCRVARRAIAGLCRMGSNIGHGSGEIAVAFSTGYRIDHRTEGALYTVSLVGERHMDKVFRGAVEAVEDAVYSSLEHAETVTGARGNTVQSLGDYMAEKGI